ncbi:MAG: Quinone oxidoreductase 1 [Alphaproteobacteria bacterium MarineAlpha9_Bin4]|nr:MAG: Quinone oxidoreductase 1 [Alphaproteobacteria bacterium MarineAlpha9_Bin4]|tara:strand:- start:109 stop:1101 length:993 start_codon:yes stop_codon:yes gene_type:complete
MLKVEFKKIGIPEKQLYLTETTTDEKLKFNEVLIEVLFFPINPADLLLVEGKYGTASPTLPSLIGAECIAKVLKVGKKVKKVQPDDIVMPLTRDNWAEKLKVTEENLIRVNRSINLVQASMLKVNPATAYLILNNYIKLNQGDKILQNAANSGVGTYIIQLAKYYKIKTINIVRRKETLKELKKLGANKIILNNLKNNKIITNKVKLFIDAIGGPEVDKWASYLEDHGTIINYGLLSGKNIEINTNKVIFKNISLKGFWLSLWLQKMSYSQKFNLYSHLSELIMKNVLHTKIDQIYHVKDIKKAVLKARKYKRNGKIIVAFKKENIKKYI